MSKRITTKDGTELYVKDWGHGPTLFFVSSAGASNEMWQYQHAHYVRQGFRVVAYDRRGHGRSDQPYAGYDADTLADDMATVIEGIDLRDITIIAHSFGCAEVVRYLLRHARSARRSASFSSAAPHRLCRNHPTIPTALTQPSLPACATAGAATIQIGRMRMCGLF